jgi:formamidopyrimidine-DNA glycosylase
MFELPEILKLAKQMNDTLKGKIIASANLNDATSASLLKMGFIFPSPRELETSLTKKTIDSTIGKGKWIYVKLKPEKYLLLGEISGKVLYHHDKETLPDKYHLKLDFADGSFLTVQVSFYGFIKIVKEEELEAHRYPGKLGVSPVDDKEFTLRKFNDILAEGRSKVVKYVLLEQTKIAGIGNGYLQDILFKAKIHPKRKAADLSEKERIALYNAVKETLNEAIRLGGSEQEIDLYGNLGGYRRILGEHMKGKPCPRCGTPIEKLNVLGSSSYICPSCQK